MSSKPETSVCDDCLSRPEDCRLNEICLHQEKHAPTSCLSDALRGIHALNSDVLPGASTTLFYQCSNIPKGNRKCLKYLGEGVLM